MRRQPEITGRPARTAEILYIVHVPNAIHGHMYMHTTCVLMTEKLTICNCAGAKYFIKVSSFVTDDNAAFTFFSSLCFLINCDAEEKVTAPRRHPSGGRGRSVLSCVCTVDRVNYLFFADGRRAMRCADSTRPAACDSAVSSSDSRRDSR